MRRPELIWILLGAFALRLVVAIVWAPAPVTDAADYLRLASGLASGEGLVNTLGDPTSWRPPGYPAFLAVLVGDGSPSLWIVRVVQAALSAASVGLVYVLADRWFGRATAIVAGVLAAVNLASVMAVSRLLSETLFVVLFLAALYALSVAMDDERRSRAAAWAGVSGIVLGLAALVRSIVLPLPLAVAGALVVRRLDRAPMALALVVGFVLALAPWTVRNYRVHDAFVPVATQTGATLYAGNHPRDGFVFGVMAEDDRTRASRTMSEVEADGFLRAATLEDWRANPGQSLRVAAMKMLYFWVPADWEILPWYGAFNPTYAFLLLALAALAVLGGYGVGGWIEIGRAWPVWLPIAYVLLVALVFYGSPRLRMPVEPLMCIVAAVAIQRYRVWAPAAFARRSLAVATVGILALTVAWEPLKGVLKSGLLAWSGGG